MLIRALTACLIERWMHAMWKDFRYPDELSNAYKMIIEKGILSDLSATHRY